MPASFGTAPYRLIAAGTTNGANIKASPGVLYGWIIQNVAASVRYVKLYDRATAPTVGTHTPFLTIPLAATSVSVVTLDNYPITFSSGLGIGTTNLVADSDTTAVTAGDLIINLLYA